MIHAHVDIETASDLDLTDVGVDVYARHPSTRILMVSWKLAGGDLNTWTIEDGPPPPALSQLLRNPEVRKFAHNAYFEFTLFTHVWMLDLDITHWRCTMVWAYMLSLPGSLDQLGDVLLLPPSMKKAKDGLRLIRLFSMPQKITKKQPHRWHSATTRPAEWAKFVSYNRQDVIAEEFVADRRLSAYPIPDSQWADWFVDHRINERGLPIDRQLVDRACRMITTEVAAVREQLTALTGLDNVNSDAQFGPWIRARGYPFGDLQKASVQKILDDELYEDIHPPLLLRAQLKLTSVAKYPAVQESVASDDRLRHTYAFSGASRTGRWAGRGAHFQNPKKAPKELEPYYEDIIASARVGDGRYLREMYGSPLRALSACVRGMIRAPQGYHLLVADLASIESRVIARLARCPPMLQVFEEGLDVYRVFAMHLFHVEYDEVTKQQRNHAKPPVLGCFAAETQVLTQRGWVFIVSVLLTDQLFDGVEWVSHGGLLNQGFKEVIDLDGVRVTPDHLVLTEGGWRCAQSLVRTSRWLRSAQCLARGLLSDMSVSRMLGSFGIDIGAGVSAGPKRTWSAEAWRKVSRIHASLARMHAFVRQLRSPVVTILTRVLSSDCRIASTLFEHVVSEGTCLKPVTPGEVFGVCLSQPRNLFFTALLCPAGTTQPSKLIGSITTVTTNRITYVLRHVASRTAIKNAMLLSSIKAGKCVLRNFGRSTRHGIERLARFTANFAKVKLRNRLLTIKPDVAVPTYDIRNAGPRNRFVVLTSHGPIIVHNCGFRLSGGQMMPDRRSGDMKKTGLWGYADNLGIPLTQEEARYAVEVFRATYPEVPQLWYDIEEAVFHVLQRGGERDVGLLGFDCVGPFLRMHLPSGRRLHYLRPKLEQREMPWTGKDGKKVIKWSITFEGVDEQEDGRKVWGRQVTHGGKVAENATQAVANDILRVGLGCAENEGFHIVGHSHDEGIALERLDSDLTVDGLCDSLSRPIGWFPGVPLAAAGFEAQFYRKD